MSWDRVERLLGVGTLAYLRTRTVGVIGLGSGGSFAAVALAMSGVGRFILIDDDTLEPPNVVRHVADRRYLGQSKAAAVADLIHQRNPDAVVEAIHGRIEDHLPRLAEMDVVVVGVDAEGPKYAVNQACLAAGRTAVYAGVYERGEGGDVCVIRPDEGPCYACWAEHLREGLAEPVGGEAELDYGMIGPDGTLAAEPGLWIHVVRVAGAQADLALNVLLEDTEAHVEMPGNTVILANRQLEIYEGRVTPPYGAEWVSVPCNPDCLVCGCRKPRAAARRVSLSDLAALGNVSLEDDHAASEAPSPAASSTEMRTDS